MKKKLIIAAVSNFIIAGFWLLFINPINSLVSVGINISFGAPVMYAIFLIVSGIVYINYSNLSFEEFRKKKNTLLALGIISIWANIISAILILILVDAIEKIDKGASFTSIGATSPPKITVDPEVKKIDTLLKLGVFMVILSGIIFATTTWETTPNIFRFIFLIVLGLLFLGLSNFSEKKIKIEKTVKTYWILSEVFFGLAFMSLGYFQILGEWFSLGGAGESVFTAALMLEISTFMFITYKKFKSKGALYTTYIGLTLSALSIMTFFDLDILIAMLVFTSIFFIINITKKAKTDEIVCLEKYSQVASYITAFITLISFGDNTTSKYLVIAATIVTLVNLLYLAFKDNGEFKSIMTPMVIMVYIPVFVARLDLSFNNYMIVALVATAFAYISLSLTKLAQGNKLFVNSLQICMNLLLFGLSFVAFAADGLAISVAAIILLFTNLILYFRVNHLIIKPEYYLQPFKFFLAACLALSCISKELIELSASLNLGVLIAMMLLMHYIIKEGKLKFIYYVMSIILVLFSTTMVDGDTDKIGGLLLLVSTFAPFIIAEIENEPRYKKSVVPTFIIMLLAISYLLIEVNFFEISSTIYSLIVLSIYAVITYIYRNRKTLFTISSIAIVIPFVELIDNLNAGTDISTILNSLLLFYILFIVCKNFIKTVKTRNIVASIFASLILLTLVFTDSVLIGLYIGVTSLVLIAIGYSIDEYKAIFKTGILFSVINIIFQLRTMWSAVPFWLYLLVVGLALIGFVTYKELNKINKKEDKK